MDGFGIIDKYFPDLDVVQRERLFSLGALYAEWNSKINLVSRKDIDSLFERHVLHSLSIAKFIRFKTGTSVMDLGTGGGFPGIPLAIFFPNTHFTLVDSIAKKTLVVKDIANRLGLTNVQVLTSRAESIRQEFDFVISRATAPLGDLHRWSSKNISKKQVNAIPNGIICLKGGDLKEELDPFKNRVEVVDLTEFFVEEFFQTKKLVYLPC
ncbi:MAG: 16S rRNA (guanine(527)-N(7))-methyltransferase RsmG [Bacteroidota bacterium]